MTTSQTIDGKSPSEIDPWLADELRQSLQDTEQGSGLSISEKLLAAKRAAVVLSALVS